MEEDGLIEIRMKVNKFLCIFLYQFICMYKVLLHKNHNPSNNRAKHCRPFIHCNISVA